MKLDAEEVLQAAQDALIGRDNPGFCIECGVRQEGCEPDVRMYPCESCGAMAVYGAEQIILEGFLI